MKSTLLLSTALFLISAPAPDSGDIAEMTSNFIVPADVPGLQAAEAASLSGSLKTFDLEDNYSEGVKSNDSKAAEQDRPRN